VDVFGRDVVMEGSAKGRVGVLEIEEGQGYCHVGVVSPKSLVYVVGECPVDKATLEQLFPLGRHP
jgi:hypothetical protein